jgi:excinuclease ABC subunit C
MIQLDSDFMNIMPKIPTTPGIYMFRDSDKKVIYIGKAVNIRSRIRNYFGIWKNLPVKIQNIRKQAQEIEFIQTSTENEALLLENTLIKQYKPLFNIRLRDDKTYPYIKIKTDDEFPLVQFTRKVIDDGSSYFGPYANTGAIRKTLDLLGTLFQYRSCTKEITGTDPRPCLEYHLNRCLAPCTGYITRDKYHEIIDHIAMFLEGNTKLILKELKQQMKLASNNLDYEKAAKTRDQINAIKKTSEAQKVTSSKSIDADFVGLEFNGNQAWVEIFLVRSGKLIGREHFILDGTKHETKGSILSAFASQYYQKSLNTPSQIMLPVHIEDEELISQWLSKISNKKVSIVVPIRGKHRKLLDMTQENAKLGFFMQNSKKITQFDRGLSELQDAIGVSQSLDRIECYDISNIQGSDPVGSMVVFKNGKPSKKDYRKFKIQSIKGINDYAMMYEMLSRRLKKLTNSLDTPNLIIIDGGIGHLSTVEKVFLELGISTQEIPLISLAKENEEIYTLNSAEPIALPKESESLYLIQRIRDEAHRFAITFHRNLRSKRQTSSILDTIRGIGPVKREAIRKQLGDIASIRKASIEELTSIPGITESIAKRIKNIDHSKEAFAST